MGCLTRAQGGTVDRVPAGLSERLQWLRRYGQPRLHFMSDGWHARIEMNTNTTGAEFQVKSEFSHATPDAAVAVLIERMLHALAAATKESRNG